MRIPLLNLCYGNGGSLIAEILSALGIEYIFTIAGSQTLPVMHGISDRHKISIVTSRSERNSVFMAEGYGKALNFPAVTLSTLGPGIANELPALYSAMRNTSPILSISPYQPPWKILRLGEIFQGMNHPEFLKSVVKKNYIINEIEKLPKVLTDSFQKSLEEPMGPIHLDISFPILFKPNFYFNFKRSNIKKDRIEKMCIIYENSDFCKFLDLNVFSGEENVLELLPGDDSGTLPFALGVKFAIKEKPVIVFVSVENLLKNLDSFAVATANGIRPLIISIMENPELQKITDVFKIEYKNNISNTFLQKSNTINIIVVG